jgi:hypothetical protein
MNEGALNILSILKVNIIANAAQRRTEICNDQQPILQQMSAPKGRGIPHLAGRTFPEN